MPYVYFHAINSTVCCTDTNLDCYFCLTEQDVHNSCPIYRHELQTDDHAYESWKEREKEAEEDRKGTANAVRGGEYMYV
jgi:hypothetical protein